jgi:hypothetical protein
MDVMLTPPTNTALGDRVALDPVARPDEALARQFLTVADDAAGP